MTSPEDAKTLFADATADFSTITGSPTGDNVKYITEVLTNLLQSINVPGGKDSLLGLLDDDAQYQTKWGHSIDRLAVSLPAYDETIATNVINTVHNYGSI